MLNRAVYLFLLLSYLLGFGVGLGVSYAVWWDYRPGKRACVTEPTPEVIVVTRCEQAKVVPPLPPEPPALRPKLTAAEHRVLGLKVQDILGGAR